MKRRITSALLMAAIIALSGCTGKTESSKPAETTTAATTTAEQTSNDIATETAPTETTAPVETEATETTTLPEDKVTCPYDFDFDVTMFDGTTRKFSEADSWSEYSFTYNDFACARFTTGTTYDSTTNPEMFDVPNYGFTGDMYSLNPEWFEVHVGDTFCDGALTATGVETSFQYMYDTEAGELNYYEIMANNITLDGTFTMKGRCVCAKEEDVYTAIGDVFFTPFVDSITDFPMNANYIGTTSWAADMSDAWVLDSLSQNIGNIVDNSMLGEYLENGETKNLEITFSDIYLTYSDQRGFGFEATIESVSEYEF